MSAAAVMLAAVVSMRVSLARNMIGQRACLASVREAREPFRRKLVGVFLMCEAAGCIDVVPFSILFVTTSFAMLACAVLKAVSGMSSSESCSLACASNGCFPM